MQARHGGVLGVWLQGFHPRNPLVALQLSRHTCRSRFPEFFMYSSDIALHPSKSPCRTRLASTARGVTRQAASQKVLGYRVL